MTAAIPRRSVLKGAGGAAVGVAAGLAAGPALAADVRRARRETVAELEIYRLPINRRGDWLILKLRTASGLIGLGDASHSGVDAETLVYLKRFADWLRGRSIFDVEAFVRETAQIARRQTGKAAIVAASALEQCLWDLIGKALDVPTYDLFGGALRDRIPLYANINRSTDPRTPDGFAAMATRAVEAGFDAIKLAPFDALPADVSRDKDVRGLIGQGVASAKAVRSAIGPQRKLLIDVHSRLTPAEGRDLLPRFEPLDLYWLEETVPAVPIADLAEIKRAAPMPTAGGESLSSLAAFYAYIAADAVDIVMPDVKICGGLLALRKIAALAEAAELMISPHGPASPIGNVAAAQIAATLPNFEILEYAFGEVPWRGDLLRGGERIEKGAFLLSKAPGLGITIDDHALARHSSRL